MTAISFVFKCVYERLCVQVHMYVMIRVNASFLKLFLQIIIYEAIGY